MKPVIDANGYVVRRCFRCADKHGNGCVVEDTKTVPRETCPLERGVTLKYRFFKGKHDGKTVEQVIADDAQYIVWCVRTTRWFEIADSTRDAFDAAVPHLKQDLYDAEVYREETYTTNH